MTGAINAGRGPGRIVHGTSKTAVQRACPCRTCDDFRERPRGFSHDPDWIDEMAVERVAAGESYHERLSVKEREEVVRLLHRQRMTDRDIARRTGMADRTVLRIRQRLGLLANWERLS